MAAELTLRFVGADKVAVRLDGDAGTGEAAEQPFAGPLDAAAQADLQWYLERYPTQYGTEVDDARARAIAANLPEWGAGLFGAVFVSNEARRLFDRFLGHDKKGRVLTVDSDHPSVLGQPWELLRDPSGTFLFLETNRISVRRRQVGAGGGRAPFRLTAKKKLHLLFVVSRPKDAGFIDPRADPQAVLDAIDAEAPGRITVEFLRPATIAGLIKRLEKKRLAAVDVLHFDGHGAYDPDGSLAAGRGEAAQPGGAGALMRAAGRGEPHQGYLLFEKADGGSDPVSARRLGELLHRQKVALVVLSACQSAKLGGNDPMGSVAARLVHAGLPSVLAMTHSVLVDTTRQLFGYFYRELGQAHPVGQALDEARRLLYFEPGRGERQRTAGRIVLELQDWFVPALYQAGRSPALLTGSRAAPPPARAPADNVQPVQEPGFDGRLPSVEEAGFHGRRRELWETERWFVGGTRRIVVSGFGGQGKTCLAAEAGRWLRRTLLFDRVCFVGYARFQGSDPVSAAVNALATVLGENLIDAKAAAAALARVKTLLIFDNLEALEAEPRRELLATASNWSGQGGSRVLITTRPDTLAHADYPRELSKVCRYLDLKGLAEDDALDWFQALMRLPPEPTVRLPAREALAELFRRVEFHPLSIGLLAQQLRTRRIAELGERLEALLGSEGSPLLASLALSLDRLAPEVRAHLPGLGVFQGGAFEDDLVAVTGLDAAAWQGLRRGLEQAGLVRIETVAGCEPPFLRFHPTLAPALWDRLPAEQQAELATRYRAEYREVAGFLYHNDTEHAAVVRDMAARDLPNLLAAVRQALDQRETGAVDFAEWVCRFLAAFGRLRDRAELNRRMQALGDLGSDDRFVAGSNQAEQLIGEHRFAEAERLLHDLVVGLGEAISYKKCACRTALARCTRLQGRPGEAETILRQALDEVGRLETSRDVRTLIGTLHTDLADALRDRGDYGAAEAEYEAGAAIAREQSNDRALAVSLGQLGTLALREGDFAKAEKRYRAVLGVFKRLGEPAQEATTWHQLGKVYSKARRFDLAERAYRESARIRETLGKPAGAAGTWDQLATMFAESGRSDLAEPWYRKALAAWQDDKDTVGESITLNNTSPACWQISRAG
jgi:tetratricopeptide (TPR) repeat protein